MIDGKARLGTSIDADDDQLNSPKCDLIIAEIILLALASLGLAVLSVNSRGRFRHFSHLPIKISFDDVNFEPQTHLY